MVKFQLNLRGRVIIMTFSTHLDSYQFVVDEARNRAKIINLTEENKKLKEEIEELKQKLEEEQFKNEMLHVKEAKREEEEDAAKELEDYEFTLDGF